MRKRVKKEQMTDLERCVLRWWRGFRPLDFNLKTHIENPTVNMTRGSKAEKRLGRLAGEIAEKGRIVARPKNNKRVVIKDFDVALDGRPGNYIKYLYLSPEEYERFKDLECTIGRLTFEYREHGDEEEDV